MNKVIKRNKSKVWRETYGCIFLTRRAVKLAVMAQVQSCAIHQLRAIKSAGGDRKLKAVAISKLIISSTEEVAKLSLDLNKGFVK